MGATLHAKLGFMSRDGVHMDTQRPGHVLRAPTRPKNDMVYQALETHVCALRDFTPDDTQKPNIETYGFETIDLSGLPKLQTLLQKIRSANLLTHPDIKNIRRALYGRSFKLANGKTLRILFIANEGTIMRTVGPNGLIINQSKILTEINHKIGAPAVHADQDVRGTPVKQILKGAGPLLLRHEAPDGCNRRSPFFLVNMWIPLQQITQPLVLMDERSWNRKQHQLRYATPVDDFLDRSSDRKMNDIWTVLHDPGQRWHFNSSMYSDKAYIFNTLSNPHGATTLPGEDRAEQLYRALQSACLGDTIPPVDITLHPDCPEPLRQAITEMEILLADTRRQNDWQQQAQAAMDRVIRKSIEMRMLVWIS